MVVRQTDVQNIPKSGKKSRPKTAVKGKRYHCASAAAQPAAGKDARALVLPGVS